MPLLQYLPSLTTQLDAINELGADLPAVPWWYKQLGADASTPLASRTRTNSIAVDGAVFAFADSSTMALDGSVSSDQAYTLALLCRRTGSYTGYLRALSLRTTTADIVWIERSEGGKIYGAITDSSNIASYYGYTQNNTIPQDETAFVVFTVTPGGRAILYVNGAPVVDGAAPISLKSGGDLSAFVDNGSSVHADALQLLLPYAMSGGEVARYAATPWDLFEKQRIYVPGAIPPATNRRLITYTSERTHQPDESVDINLDHPYAKRASVLWSANGPMVNLADGSEVTVTGAMDLSADLTGMVRGGAALNTYLNFTSAAADSGRGLSWLAYGVFRGNGNTSSRVFLDAPSAMRWYVTNTGDVIVQGFNWLGTAAMGSFAGDGYPVLMIGGKGSNGVSYYGYINGTPVVAWPTGGWGDMPSAGVWKLGTAPSSSYIAGFRPSMFGLFPDVPADELANVIGLDPWQLFNPQTTRYTWEMSSGGILIPTLTFAGVTDIGATSVRPYFTVAF